jgi:hypothetical protein
MFDQTAARPTSTAETRKKIDQRKRKGQCDWKSLLKAILFCPKRAWNISELITALT